MSPNVTPPTSRAPENVLLTRNAAPMTDVDEVAVERAVLGDRTVHLTRAELFLAFTRLDAAGHSANSIGELLGVSERSVTRWRKGQAFPKGRPSLSSWSAPTWTCETCGDSMTHNRVRHRQRHHSEVST